MMKFTVLLCPVFLWAVFDSSESCQTVPSGYWVNVYNLDLTQQNISHLSSLSGYPRLQTADLSNNFLDALDMSHFRGLNNIEEIVASNNQINAIVPPLTGVQFPSLRSLKLAGNKIQTLNSGDLDGITNLQTLDLALNPLISLGVVAVEGHVQNGGTISINNTPLACSCQYKELNDWAVENSVTINAECLPGDVDTCEF